MQFHKYHALGNDYLVFDPSKEAIEFRDDEIIKICHRNFGLGSDGILYGPLDSSCADFKLRIFNPDASEAEKSGNGLRIFCRYLFDQQLVNEGQLFTVETLGGVVEAEVYDGGQLIKVGMGNAIFTAKDIPVDSESPEEPVINQEIHLGDCSYTMCCVSVGNPHCVIPMDAPTAELAHQIGPQVENHQLFPNRINMQLLKILDRNNIQIEIWERGAGYTLASGTSSCAAATIAHKLGLCDGDITVHCPGGEISVSIGENYALMMIGPVTPVGVFEMHPEVVQQALPEVR